MYDFFFSSRRRHTRLQGDWSSDVCSSEVVHGKKTKLYRIAALVLVANSRNLIADSGIDAEFLFEFPAQRISRLLAIFDLAPGKLPLEGHGLMLGALTDENLSILDDECR